MTRLEVQTAACPPIEILEWDSIFFGMKVGRVRLEGSSLSQLTETVEEADRLQIDCLYWLADSDDPNAPRAASACGFQLVDVRVTLERKLGAIAIDQHSLLPAMVRPFRPADLSELLPMAALSHRSSRFFYDGHFPEERCTALYDAWLRKACSESSDLVLVAEVAGRPIGYCICAMRPGGPGSISLIAVDSQQRRSGAGTSLVIAALNYFGESGAALATVVTQGRNIASQRLYQKCGFVTQSLDLWYHRWRSESA